MLITDILTKTPNVTFGNRKKKKQEKVSSEAHCFEKHKLKNKFLYFLKQLVKLKK